MIRRIRKMHPFGLESNESTSYYFTPLKLPAAYRERHEAGLPFSTEEVKAIAQDGLDAAIYRGEMEPSQGRAVELSVSKVPDEDHWLVLDYNVVFKSSDDVAGAVRR